MWTAAEATRIGLGYQFLVLMILLRDGGQHTLGKDLLASPERLRSFDSVSMFRVFPSPTLALLRPPFLRLVRALAVPA